MTALSLAFVFSAVFLSYLFRPDNFFGPSNAPFEQPFECGANERWHEPNITNACSLGCAAGCVCMPGYMMMEKGCVPEKFGDVKCKENEELRCGVYECQEFCDIGIDPLCYLNRYDCFFAYECFCKEGYIRVDDDDCIPLSECPSKVLLQDYEED